MRKYIEPTLSMVLTLTTVVMAVIVVRREFFVAPRPAAAQEATAPVYLEQWAEAGAVGHTDGTATAPITLVEFSDLECPFCREFHTTLRAVRAQYPEQITHVFVHFPLRSHRFARPAARAAECAGQQDRFAPFIDVIFEKQDSLGLKPWTAYARAAGVTDSLAFATCVEQTAPVPAIEAGLEAGKRFGVAGTPTVILNGWRLGAPPTEAELTTMVEQLLAGGTLGSSERLPTR